MGSNIDPNDADPPKPAMILENTDNEQTMMFRISAAEVASYCDFAPSESQTVTVTYSRSQKV